jgi:hypothetical protein
MQMISSLAVFVPRPLPVTQQQTQQSIRFGRIPIDQMTSHYQALEKDFNDIYRQSKKEPVTPERPSPSWIKQMESLASDQRRWGKSVCDFMLKQPKNAMRLECLQKAYSEYSLRQEEAPPKPAPVITEQPESVNDYSQATGTFSDLEAKISAMHPGAKAVFVGSGPQPNTVVSYAKHAGAVTGVDVNPVAVKKAEKVTADLPVSGAMSFLHQDGRDVDYKGFTHVCLASMIPNDQKLAMMRRIRETAEPGTHVIVRSTTGLKRAMYEPFRSREKDLEGFKHVATIKGPAHVINESEVYVLTEPVQKTVSRLA